jgi:hypothetical protein
MAASMTAEQVRAWIEGFEAIERADIERMRRIGPRPEWSFSLALSMIEAARTSGRPLRDPNRESSEKAVRETWARLRARLLP